ncbi:MAG: phosphoglycerate kinase, partial [Candidatus Nanohaloarchaea archaeon]
MRTIDEMDADSVLMRIDINSPVEDGAVQDNKRFARHAETIRELIEDDTAVALLAHQGRPGRDTYLPLEQHADILSDHLGQEVRYVDEIVGDTADAAIDDLAAGEVLLLENVRFRDEELEDRSPSEHAESDLVQALHDRFDAYVNDAYSVAHRPHASVVGFPPVMDAYAGPVMETEWENNTRIRDGLEGTTVMLVGGKKVGDVVQVMDDLMDEVDEFLITGLVGELFLRAKGYDVGYDVNPGDTFMHEQWLDNRDAITDLLETHGDSIYLP